MVGWMDGRRDEWMDGRWDGLVDLSVINHRELIFDMLID